MSPTREQLIERERRAYDNLNAGIADVGPYAQGCSMVGSLGIMAGKEEITTVLKRYIKDFDLKYERRAGPVVVMDVAPGIHCVVSEFTLTMNDGAGGRASYGTHSINFVNDALESVRSIGVNDPTDASAVKTIQDVMTRIIGGPIPGEAEAQAALHKVFDLINAHDAAGLSEMFADDAVWIAPWFKVCKGKEGDALVKASFDGGMKSVKMLEKPYTLEPFTAVVRAEVVNEGLFPVKVTQTMYRIMLDPATGKITRLAQYVDDLKGVETMRRLYNKEFAGPAESA